MRRIVIMIGMLLALAGCVPPPSNDPLDPSPAPCMAIPHVGTTICVEVLNKQAEILTRFITVTVDARDQTGGTGPAWELACKGRSPRTYPFTCETTSPYVHGIVVPKGDVVTFTVSATYVGAKGDILNCYQLAGLSNEVLGSHHTSQAPSAGAPISVTCRAVIVGPTK